MLFQMFSIVCSIFILGRIAPTGKYLLSGSSHPTQMTSPDPLDGPLKNTWLETKTGPAVTCRGAIHGGVPMIHPQPLDGDEPHHPTPLLVTDAMVPPPEVHPAHTEVLQLHAPGDATVQLTFREQPWYRAPWRRCTSEPRETSFSGKKRRRSP